MNILKTSNINIKGFENILEKNQMNIKKIGVLNDDILKLENDKTDKKSKFDKFDLIAENKNPEMTITPIEKVEKSKSPYTITIHADGTIDNPLEEENRRNGFTFGDLLKNAMTELDKIGKPGSNFQEALRLVTAVYRKPFVASYQETPTSEIQFLDESGNRVFLPTLSKDEYATKLDTEWQEVLDYLKQNKSDYKNLYNIHFGND